MATPITTAAAAPITALEPIIITKYPPVTIPKICTQGNNGDLKLETFPSKNHNPIIDYLNFEDGLERAIASVFGEACC